MICLITDQAGTGGWTESGTATGGSGLGGGGSAVSAGTGTSLGGSVNNDGGLVDVNSYKSSEYLSSISVEIDMILIRICAISDQAGDGGVAISGAAIGGNALRRDNTYGQGGSAQSGFSGSVNGGDSNNAGGFIFNNPYGS